MLRLASSLRARHFFGPSYLPYCRLGLRSLSSTHGGRYSKGTVELSYTSIIPEDGNATSKPLVILHGLFGSKRNWISICKALHRDMPHRPIYALDMRNHGTSPHTTPHTYQAMAEDVHKFIEDKGLSQVALLGHSMHSALSQLIVVDIAPSIGKLSAEFQQYTSAMQQIEALPFGAIKTRTDADKRLREYEPDLSIRQFLLTNLQLPGQSHDQADAKAKFIVPLDILSNSIDELGSFPYKYDSEQKPVDVTWDGPTLVYKGTQSAYINHKNIPALEAFFPNMRMEELDTGHWVHAEKPTEFRKILVSFLDETSR
ncbi:hypothetical protein D9619_006509 [Psilocybe cf. subviscida]|uniref:AB hydrolase-1 domain-containing protein n=1 Tax=Psilocybe cf. subviscida TaxID=2480587 RepID=A0A8H5EYB6_9AGAR|nr:hypothetical protein D9619_006509 [Psilocybe cf. subviscida]